MIKTSLVLYQASAFIQMPTTPLHLKGLTNNQCIHRNIFLCAKGNDSFDEVSRSLGSSSSDTFTVKNRRDLVIRGVSSLEKDRTIEAEATIVDKEGEGYENATKVGQMKSIGDFLVEKMGSVDESRLAYPEIASGEVPRMFSNINYKQTVDAEGKESKLALHASGSVLGSAALVAGTTIGAGVLALPTATAPAGFLPSSAALGVAWVYMTISGLLIAELCINRMGDTGKQGVGLLEIYKTYLGEGLGRVGSTAYFFLHYAIMVAYLSQGGANLGNYFDSMGLSSVAGVPGLDQIIFATSVGGLVYLASPSVVEKINNVLVLGVIGTFLGIIGIGAGSADFNALVASENQHAVSQVIYCPLVA